MYGGTKNMEKVEPIRDKKQIQAVKEQLKKNGTRDLLLFVMGINTGLRISDIIPLRVADVRGKTHVILTEKKTGKTKKFPLNNAVQEVLNPYIANMNDDEFLFKSRQGGSHITRQQAYGIINQACRAVGITDKIGTHTLRKTFGYHHYNQNKDVALLQKIFNHSAPSVTLRYIGIDQDTIDESYNNFSL